MNFISKIIGLFKKAPETKSLQKLKSSVTHYKKPASLKNLENEAHSKMPKSKEVDKIVKKASTTQSNKTQPNKPSVKPSAAIGTSGRIPERENVVGNKKRKYYPKNKNKGSQNTTSSNQQKPSL